MNEITFNKFLELTYLPESHKRFSRKTQFWLFLLAAIIIHQIPFVSIPFKWLESFFHEISHGLAALITGGSIVKIQLFPNGAGLCTTRGGSALLISFMGYAGASIWGAMLFSIASVNKRLALMFSSALMALLVLCLIFWVRDVLTLVIVALVLALLVLPYKFKKIHYLQPFMQLTGMMVLLNSLYSPLHLFDGRSIGDGAALANITLIPELVWVAIWMAIAAFSLYLLSKSTFRKAKV